MPALLRSRLALVSAATLLLGALAGCATPHAPTQALLTYETKPEGAALFEGGQPIGTAPVTRTYSADGKGDNVRTPVVTAVWPSGAKETFFTLLPLGADRVATIERPASAPGLQTDLDHARKLAQARQQDQKRQTEAQLRDQKRNSDRCRAQAAGASRAVQDDC